MQLSVFLWKIWGCTLGFFFWINGAISGIFRGADINCYCVGNIDAAVGFAKKSKNVFAEVAFVGVRGFLICNRNNQISDVFIQNFVTAKFLFRLFLVPQNLVAQGVAFYRGIPK